MPKAAAEGDAQSVPGDIAPPKRARYLLERVALFDVVGEVLQALGVVARHFLVEYVGRRVVVRERWKRRGITEERLVQFIQHLVFFCRDGRE